MIDYKSLRPGNWIHPTGRSRYVVVTGLLLGMMEKNEEFCKEFEGIELTGELLIAGGGRNMGGWTGLFLEVQIWDEKVELGFQLMDGVLTIMASDSYIKKIDTPKLHDLQNWYFLLSGSELPLSESAKIIPHVTKN